MLEQKAGIPKPGEERWFREWQLGIQSTAQDVLASKGNGGPATVPSSTKNMLKLLKTGCEYKAWTKLTDERNRPFKSFAEFCLHRRPWGLGIEYDRFYRYLLDNVGDRVPPELPVPDAIAKAKENPLAKHGRPSKDESVVSPKAHGTSREYLLARLSRDFPEVLDEIGNGKKYRSARAAAIAMGIIEEKKSIQFSVKETGGQIAGKLHQKLTDQQMAELAEALQDYAKPKPVLPPGKSHILEDCCVPPLEKALRLMKEAKVENKWNNVAGMVDRVLRELEKAEQQGDEWGKSDLNLLCGCQNPPELMNPHTLKQHPTPNPLKALAEAVEMLRQQGQSDEEIIQGLKETPIFDCLNELNPLRPIVKEWLKTEAPRPAITIRKVTVGKPPEGHDFFNRTI